MTGSIVAPAPAETATDRLPLSSAQAALWFAQQLQPANPIFNIATAVEIEGELDLALFRRAADRTMAEATALSMRVEPGAELFGQRPGTPPAPLGPLLDLSAETDPMASFRRLVADDVAVVHDVTTGPPVRQELIRLAPDRHLWYLRTHHVLLDGYGVNLLFRRAGLIYTALAAGREPRGGFADPRELLDEEQQYLDSPAHRADADFWSEHLRSIGPGVVLQPGAERLAQRSRVGEITLGTDAFADANRLADETGTAWGTVMIAAFAAYVARHLARPDITIGLPMMNRLGSVAAKVPTMVVNLLPLAMHVGPSALPNELVEQAHEAMADIQPHQRFRGVPIGDGTRLASGFSDRIGPVVNVKPFGDEIRFGPLRATIRSLCRGPVQDMSATISATPDGDLRVQCDADADRYSAEELERHLVSIRRFMRAFVAPEQPGSVVRRLPLAAADELDLLRDRWSGAEVGPADDATLLDIFAASVRRRPRSTAIVVAGESLTFAELDLRSNRLARKLIRDGVRIDDRVALHMPSSTAMVVAMLATWKAGAAYVPVDPAYPAERVRHILEDAAASVLTRSDVDADLDGLSQEPLTAEERGGRLHADNSAYVIYTSGSTGRPKGVVVAHRGPRNLLRSHRHYTIDTTAQRPLRVLSTYSFAFDSSIGPLLWMLDGNELHALERDAALDAAAVVEYVGAQRIDYIDAVPVLMEQYLDHGLLDSGAHRPARLAVGGEAVSASFWTRMHEDSALTAFNLYGPTEASVDSGFAVVADAPTPTIGRPTYGGRLYVLDAFLAPCGIGHIGELYIGGPQLARGYHGRHGLTAQRFVANPFEAGERLYRTGDLARWQADGQLEYLGRGDDQVQIRGFRVELGEVESAVANHIDADRVVADVRTGPNGAPRLVAYLVRRDTEWAAPTIDALRRALADELPDYMIPAAFVGITELPLSPNGKVDRTALPEPQLANGDAGAPIADDLVRAICSVFADLLDLAAVGPDDDFFSLGGDSIVSIRLSTKLKQLGLGTTPRDVFECRTPAALAARGRSTVAATVLEPAGYGIGELPRTPIIARVMAHGGRLDRFSQAMVLHAPAAVQLATLTEAVATLLDTHDMLRASLRGELLTVAAPDEVDHAPVVSEQLLDAPGDERTVLDRLADELDLAAGSVFRIILLRYRSGALPRLGVLVHHIAVDGVSWRVLLDDLAAAYDLAAAGSPLALPPVPTSFRRWAQSLEELGRTGHFDAQLPYWRETARRSGTHALAARALDERRDLAATAETMTVEVPAEITERLLGELPRRFNAGVQDGLVAALAVAVASTTGDTDFVFDIEGHGREETVAVGADLSRTVGWFTSFYPVRVALGDLDVRHAMQGGAAAGSALKLAKERLRAAPDNGIGYSVLAELDPADRLAALDGDRPEVLFNYLGRMGTSSVDPHPWTPADPDRPLQVRRDPSMPCSHALVINAMTVPSTAGNLIRAEWSWPAELLAADTVAELHRNWLRALTGLSTYLAESDTAGLTPSDTVVSGLTQDEIDEFEADWDL
ncbi:non-ribosomal peptide synthetase [Nocardia altamirensis]|uniref:non-ribosomal peptide synthetase n=1 Tax=Nocardia altamirensis TaxID=472158 RepID=UPI0008403DEA|nr:non-ribosomal peptide synthetase [Nocardia altamirensis]